MMDDGTAGDGIRSIEAVVRGRVQGVGFRWFVQQEASRLGLGGWVANEADGSVRCVATGPSADIERLIERLHEGPPSAWVERVEVHPQAVPDRAVGGFDVRSGAHRGD